MGTVSYIALLMPSFLLAAEWGVSRRSFPFASGRAVPYSAASFRDGDVSMTAENNYYFIMKHWIACSLLLSVLLLAGCESVNHSQLQVMAPTPERGAAASVPAAEREQVKQVVSQVAQHWRMEDRTALSLTPDTICSYAQPDVKHPISIKAWLAGDRISIDIFQPPPEPGESSAYQQFRNDVMGALEKQFGARLVQVQKLRQVSSKTGK